MGEGYKYCEHCGEKISAGAQICPKCGYACNDQVYYRQGTGQSQGYQEPDIPSGGMNALSFFIPIVGIVMYFVCRNETPIKAKSMLKFAIIGICVGVGLTILINVISYVMVISTVSNVSRYLSY